MEIGPYLQNVVRYTHLIFSHHLYTLSSQGETVAIHSLLLVSGEESELWAL